MIKKRSLRGKVLKIMAFQKSYLDTDSFDLLVIKLFISGVSNHEHSVKGLYFPLQSISCPLVVRNKLKTYSVSN